ncbi:MAG: hypothetical protein ABR501_09430 [Pyrinomonadaceae bacterium]
MGCRRPRANLCCITPKKLTSTSGFWRASTKRIISANVSRLQRRCFITIPHDEESSSNSWPNLADFCCNWLTCSFVILQYETKGPLAYVTNERDGTISVIDTVTDRVISTILVGARPRGIQVGPDKKTIWVALSYPRDRSAGWAMGNRGNP